MIFRLLGLLNTNISNDTNIFSRRSFSVFLYAHRSHGSLFAAVRSHGKHEIFEHGCHSVFFEHEYSDNTNIFLAHGSHRSHGSLFAAGRSQFLEHEIRRRPTDRREVITRMTRIFFHADLSLYLIHTRILLCFFIRTRIARISRILFAAGRSLLLEHEIIMNTNNPNDTNIICTRRRGAQCWLLNVECWIVASGRNVELLNDEYRCSHGGYWTKTIRMR